MLVREVLLGVAVACAAFAIKPLVRTAAAWLRYYLLIRRFPGPRPVPLIGNLMNGWRLRTPFQFVSYIMKTLQDIPTALFWFGPFRVIFLSEPEDVQRILTNPRHVKDHFGNIFQTVFGKGLLMQSGEIWRRHRTVISPAFNKNILNSFVPIFNQHGDIFVKKLQEKVQRKEAFDLIPMFHALAFDNNCESLLGVHRNIQSSGDSRYFDAMIVRMEVGGRRVFRPWQLPDWLFYLSSSGRIVDKSVKEMIRRRTDLILERKKKLESMADNSTSPAEDEWGRKRRLPFLDTLLLQNPSGEVLDEDEIGEEVDTFITVGQDGLCSLYQMAFTTLAQHPNVQRKIVEELMAHFPASLDTPEITADILNKLPYLDMVMKEVTRISPPVWIGWMRKTMEEVSLPSNGLVIPAGTTTFVGIKAVHMNPKHYPNPELFDPERFSPENSAARHPFAHIPFGGGHHVCIGRRFGMIQAKVVVAKTLWDFEIAPEPNSPPEWCWMVSVQSRNGLYLKLRPRIRQEK